MLWPIRWYPVDGPERVVGLAGGPFQRSFDDKHSFVVDQGVVAVCRRWSSLLYRVVQQCTADVLAGCRVVFAQNRFQ